MNGNVVFSDSVAVYGCDMGYQLEGVTQRLCDNETAEWVGTEPQCICKLRQPEFSTAQVYGDILSMFN